MMPARTSRFSSCSRRAATSISQVFPTPGAAPRKILRAAFAFLGGRFDQGVGIGSVFPGDRHGSKKALLFEKRSKNFLSLGTDGRGLLVEGQVEFQNVYAGFSNEAQDGQARVRIHQPLHVRNRAMTGGGDARYLARGVLRGNVGVETGSGGGDGIRRDRPPLRNLRRQPSPGRPRPATWGRGWSRTNWSHCRAKAPSWSDPSGRCPSSPKDAGGSRCQRQNSGRSATSR